MDWEHVPARVRHGLKTPLLTYLNTERFASGHYNVTPDSNMCLTRCQLCLHSLLGIVFPFEENIEKNKITTSQSRIFIFDSLHYTIHYFFKIMLLLVILHTELQILCFLW